MKSLVNPYNISSPFNKFLTSELHGFVSTLNAIEWERVIKDRFSFMNIPIKAFAIPLLIIFFLNSLSSFLYNDELIKAHISFFYLLISSYSSSLPITGYFNILAIYKRIRLGFSRMFILSLASFKLIPIFVLLLYVIIHIATNVIRVAKIKNIITASDTCFDFILFNSFYKF